MKILGGFASHRQFLVRVRKKATGIAPGKYRAANSMISPGESARQEAYCDGLWPDFSRARRKFSKINDGDTGATALA
jgi:hypothetical protein